MPQKHKLGFGHGTIVEHEDGTAAYVAPATFGQAFRVRISDVTGFSVLKGGKAMERTLNVLGNGTVLGTASVNHGVAEKVEAWFRAHPSFSAGGSAPAPAVAAAPDVMGQLKQLGELRDAGVLSQEEFDAKKAELLARL